MFTYRPLGSSSGELDAVLSGARSCSHGVILTSYFVSSGERILPPASKSEAGMFVSAMPLPIDPVSRKHPRWLLLPLHLHYGGGLCLVPWRVLGHPLSPARTPSSVASPSDGPVTCLPRLSAATPTRASSPSGGKVLPSLSSSALNGDTEADEVCGYSQAAGNVWTATRVSGWQATATASQSPSLVVLH